MPSVLVLTRFRHPRTGNLQNGFLRIPIEPDSTLWELCDFLSDQNVPEWVDSAWLSFWKLMEPIHRTKAKEINYTSPATESGLSALDPNEPLEDLGIISEQEANGDVTSLLVTNFCYPPVHFSLSTATTRYKTLYSTLNPDTDVNGVHNIIRSSLKLHKSDTMLYTPRNPKPLATLRTKPLRRFDPELTFPDIVTKMKELFPNGFLEDHLHFFVHVQDPVMSELPRSETPISPLAARRNNWLDQVAGVFGLPSMIETPDTFNNLLMEVGAKQWYQPSIFGSIFPVTLLVEEFRQFVDNVSSDSKLIVSAQDYELAHEWRDLILNPYSNNDFMWDIRELWGKFGITVQTSRPLDASYAFTEGDLTSDGSMYLVIGGHDAFGSGDVDTVSETLKFKVFSLLQKRMEGRLQDNYSEPCFVVIISGPCVGVFGAAFADRLIVDSLCPLETFLFHPSDDSRWDRLARLISALKIGIEALKTGCQDSEPTQTSSPSANNPATTSGTDNDASLPYHRSFVASEGHRVQEIHNLQHIHESTRVCHGELANGNPVFVKYVNQYSEEAHRACDKLGFAPKLLGSATLHAGWRIIVMEWLDPQHWKPLFLPEAKRRLNPELKEAAIAKLSEFGKAGWVHGDMRESNVMVFVGEDGEREDHLDAICLVDFDFSGRHNEVVYPHNMEMKEVPRPLNAKRLGVIEPDHDMEMMKRLLELEGKR